MVAEFSCDAVAPIRVGVEMLPEVRLIVNTLISSRLIARDLCRTWLESVKWSPVSHIRLWIYAIPVL